MAHRMLAAPEPKVIHTAKGSRLSYSNSASSSTLPGGQCGARSVTC